MSTKYKNSKDIPLSVLTDRLGELVKAIANGPNSRESEFTMRIPVELDRDADCVISETGRRLIAYDKEIQQLRERVAELEKLLLGNITNNMKCKCIGEFSWEEEDHRYIGDDEVEDYIAIRTVPWDLCKDIYKAMLKAALETSSGNDKD